MLEVEVKFPYSGSNGTKIVAGLEIVSQKSFIDAYFDNPALVLTRNDMWLRDRGGKLQIKCRNDDAGRQTLINVYTEHYSDSEIDAGIKRAELLASSASIDPVEPLSSLPDLTSLPMCHKTLKAGCFGQFAAIETTRKSFLTPTRDIRVDLDSTDFGYCIGEIEYCGAQRDTASAIAAVRAFAAERGVELRPMRGKVIEYLRLFRPKHLQALIAAGIVLSSQLT